MKEEAARRMVEECILMGGWVGWSSVFEWTEKLERLKVELKERLE
jgi:hypothetical protein